MGYRPRPRVDRALAQIGRVAYLPACPWCGHALVAHDVQVGQRVCTRGRDEPSCRVCREIRDSLFPPARAVFDFARIMASPPSIRPAPLVFGRPLADTAVRPRS
ncbi:hypothetical protein B0E38_01857 [Streptomyces sp. 111WW2]|nr:hypothetical protein B0E38_01857 [Streptomyces sp. 111WW2]